MDKNAVDQHIFRKFDEELEDIRGKVLAMGGLVEQQVDLATKAFIGYDMENAEMMVSMDREVDELEKFVDRECAGIMSRRQPAAIDLRLLFATLKMVTDLERIGDEAVGIARMTLRMETYDAYQNRYREIEYLLVMVKNMLHGALDAYARISANDGLEVTAQDAKVDKEYIRITRQLITEMRENPDTIPRALDMMWTARALERIGDHACNVCEQVIYMVKGKDVRHIGREQLEQAVNAVR